MMVEDESGCDKVERESWAQVFGHLQVMCSTMLCPMHLVTVK
jgi:hypothetical protein